MIVFVYPERIAGTDHYIMKNWRRLNVAYTRAKKKLLIVGSRNSMSQLEQLQNLLKILEQKNWIYRFDTKILSQLSL